MSENESPSDYYPKQSRWMRGLCTLIILLGYGFSEALLWFLAIVQFFWCLFRRDPNVFIQEFGVSLVKWNASAIAYCLWDSDSAPFPFSSWPKSSD